MIDKIITNNLNKKIMNERRKWGFSRKKLAKKCFTDEDTIKDIENGIYKELNLNLLINLSIALRVSIFFFLNDNLTVKELNKIMKKENLYV